MGSMPIVDARPRGALAGALIVAGLWTGLSGQATPAEITVRARTISPGEAVVVNITTSSSAQAVEVHAFERTARAYALGPGRWQALVGVDLDEEPGAYVLSAVVDGNGRAGERSIEVESRTFPVRRLTVNPDFVNPPASVQSRIADDARLLARIYANPASERLWGGGFRRPVPHRANSRFGTRSVFNGEPRNPHTGTDFLSPAGTPILAPQAGRAVAARDLYFSGNTVVLDHGLGLFSQLAHMSRIDVKEGAMVTTGQRLGLVGATGRVTGAHLHWGMRLNGARVDPLSLVALLPMDATP